MLLIIKKNIQKIDGKLVCVRVCVWDTEHFCITN